MTKKTRKRKDGKQSQSLLGALLGALLLAAAILFSQITGIDVLAILATPTPRATTVPPTLAPSTAVAGLPGGVVTVTLPQGFGAQKDFWQVFFTAPTGSRDPARYRDGIDTQLAAAINAARATVDIAAFEFNNVLLTQAVLDAHQRGLQVRIVTDDEHGYEDDDSTLRDLIEVGIPVIRDGRSDLMHNKFAILDGVEVWTGSWNFTVNDTYRNNNNALAMRSRRVVQNYQTEFDEMFIRRQFGPRSPMSENSGFSVNGTPIQVFFAPEDDVVAAIDAAIATAQQRIDFMAFSFTLDPMAEMIRDRAADGVRVRGIFETVGSETQFSELRPLFCAGLDVRQDGNVFILHHKVVVVDARLVITGSFNFSANATNYNDENLIIIDDPDLAAQYLGEFDRRWAEARQPDDLRCR